MRRLPPRFLSFDNLQTLIIPEVALPIPPRTNSLVHSSFPKSLRSLTIVHCDWLSMEYVRKVIHHQATDLVTHLPNLRAISVYWDTCSSNWKRGFYPEDYARATELRIELTGYASQHRWTALDVGGQPWKFSKNELDDMAGLPLRDRSGREIAGHWVGRKQGKDYSFGSAMMHFRKRRG